MRSAPLGMPRTAGRTRGSGCLRRAGARLLLAGDHTFEDGLEIMLDFTNGSDTKST